MTATIALAADVKFSAAPTARKGGNTIEIAFAVAAPTDATVEIIDGGGNVVRHLAAGLLGDKAPAPFQPGLSQRLAWDGKDDFGKPAPDNCKVRVSLGAQARLGKVLFSSPGLAHDPRAAAVGPDGLVYVLTEHTCAKSTFLLQAYTQDGVYGKTIMPYPANLPNDRLAGNLYVAALTKPKGEPFPPEFGRDAKNPPGGMYPYVYGGVLKFPPAGGKVHYRTGDPKAAWPPAGSEKMIPAIAAAISPDAMIEGALWCRGGVSIVPGRMGSCGCYTSRFGLDYFDRVFLPDNGLFGVRVLDTAGNPLLRFGDYGNEDSAGPGSTLETPAIPFAWPQTVSVGKSGVYVSDFINRRIVRVDLLATVEETVAV
ncbi:MAG: hypothetical protein PHU85_02095, partial [Phycisphaerae bacterium]|nr:hypothetical protein [Phycisphaerae bacterium]